MKLTLKQQRFVNFYDGNATQAAIKAGYSAKTAFCIGVENLKKPYIADAISKRTIKQDEPMIATRKERQKFWTDVMKDETEMMNNRLRAAELLGKSEADFMDKIEHSGVIEGTHININTINKLPNETSRLSNNTTPDRSISLSSK